MSQTGKGSPALLFRFLAAHRLAFYVGGLIAISLPIGLVWMFDYELPPAARTAIVGVSFGVIVLTYVAERRVGLEHAGARTGETPESYSTRLKASVALAIVGIAVGVYLLLGHDRIVGALFLVGALLFFQVAYRSERDAGAEG